MVGRVFFIKGFGKIGDFKLSFVVKYVNGLEILC